MVKMLQIEKITPVGDWEVITEPLPSRSPIGPGPLRATDCDYGHNDADGDQY